MLTVRDVARRLNVSLGCVYGLIADGDLPHLRVGAGRGTIRVDEADLADFIERGKRPRLARRSKASPSAFSHLDGQRLRQAWGDQGVP
jgi:excisionase family DNA binding protein